MHPDLVWTREAPTCAGWWWMRDSKGSICPVEIRMIGGRASAVGGIFSVEVDLMRGVEWSGPIPPPKEATDVP